MNDQQVFHCYISVNVNIDFIFLFVCSLTNLASEPNDECYNVLNYHFP